MSESALALLNFNVYIICVIQFKRTTNCFIFFPHNSFSNTDLHGQDQGTSGFPSSQAALAFHYAFRILHRFISRLRSYTINEI